MGFFGGQNWSKEFFGFSGSPSDFLGVDFGPHSTMHPGNLKSSVPQPLRQESRKRHKGTKAQRNAQREIC